MNLDEQTALLARGAASITPASGLRAKLEAAAKAGRSLNVKLGLDPTAPDIHLGFAVVLRKLRQFQDLGHQVVLIIGDFTALIGDPSGRSATRPMLSRDEISQNADTYLEQLYSILDREKTQVRFNSEWLAPLGFAELVGLCARVTVAQILEREDFANRLATQTPLGLHELLYPIAQAYDSVAIKADIELGGTDQTFNLLMGRTLQEQLGQEPQVALCTPLLVGLDGRKKMSKSLGNYIGIYEPPDSMFGKLMSISDDMMPEYFELCTNIPMDDVRLLLAQSASGETNPKDVKRRLAREVVATYHGAEAGTAADLEFDRVHARHEVPQVVEDVRLPADLGAQPTIWVCRLLPAIGLARGTTDARRLIEQGGLKIAGERLTDARAELQVHSLRNSIVQVGAKRFVRVIVD